MSTLYKLLPWAATAGILVSSSALATALTPDNYHPFGAQLNQLQYTQDINLAKQNKQQRQWKKPSVHGRGNGDLHLAASRPGGRPAQPKTRSPMAFPGEMWKGNPNAGPKPGKNPKAFPGGMWKPKPGQAPTNRNDGRNFPGPMM